MQKLYIKSDDYIYMVKQNGGSLLPWMPEEYKGVGTIAVAGDANYAKMPNVFPSNQVGGRRSRSKRSKSKRSKSKRSKSKRSRSKRSKSKRSKKQAGGMGYGFANPSAVPYAAGSYFPITPTGSAGLDASRGGNNFMSGGALLLGGAPLLGGRRTRKHRKSKKSKIQKWWQKGCSKLSGGMIAL